MSKGVNIPIAADASQVVSEGRKVAGSLDKVIDSLDDVATESRHTADATETAVHGMGTDATAAAATLERKFSEAFEQVRADAKRAGDTVDRETHAGTAKAGEATGEFKAEAVSNFSEVASSFQGDMISAVDLVQGTLGGLAGSIPGVGIAFGILGAAIGAWAAGAQADAAETKQVVDDMFNDMIESGNRWLSESFITEGVKSIIGDPAKWQQAQDLAKETGMSVGASLRALAGDQTYAREAQTKLTEAQAKARDEQAALADAYRNTGQRNVEASQANGVHQESLARLSDALGTNADRAAKAAGQADAYAGAVRAASGTTKAETDAIARGFDNLANRAPVVQHVRAVVDTSEVDDLYYKLEHTPGTIEFKARIGQTGVM